MAAHIAEPVATIAETVATMAAPRRSQFLKLFGKTGSTAKITLRPSTQLTSVCFARKSFRNRYPRVRFLITTVRHWRGISILRPTLARDINFLA